MDKDIFFSSETFGDFLRQLRVERRYSQDRMAVMMELSQNSYCMIENGRTRITLEHILELCYAIGKKPWELMEEYRIYIEKTYENKA